MEIKEAILRIEDHMIVHHIKESPNCKYITEAMEMALDIMRTYEQVRWERDIVIAQLAELGIGFGEKIDEIYLSKEEYEKLLEYKQMYEDLCE